jgi:hypothetical protein
VPNARSSGMPVTSDFAASLRCLAGSAVGTNQCMPGVLPAYARCTMENYRRRLNRNFRHLSHNRQDVL